MPTAAEWSAAGSVALANAETARQRLQASLQRRIVSVRSASSSEAVRHDAEIKRLASIWASIRDDCPHDETDYDIDPSGNSGGSVYCKLCAAERTSQGKWV